MNYSAQYDARKRTPEQAVSLIRKEDSVLAAGSPGALLEALYQARDRFDGLRLFSVFGLAGAGGAALCAPETANHVMVSAGILGRHEENAWQGGSIDQAPVHLSAVDEYIADNCRPTIVMVHCPPPDNDGFFYPGVDCGGVFPALERGAKVIVQVDRNLPLIFTDTRIHVTDAVSICEADEPLPARGAEYAEATEADKAIAGYVAELIPDGSTIQLGAGLLPELTGRLLVDRKDLGIHTDCFNAACVELMKKGAVNNSKKEVMRGVSVGAFFDVPPEDLKYLDKNPQVMMKDLSWVSNPSVIKGISGMRTVNEGLAVDFRAQVCCSNLGMGFTGGPGSQLDFARGAKRCKDGLSFFLMRSTAVDKDGARVSRVYPGLPEGSLVSVPRSDMMYVVTEYGAVNIRDMGVKERVKALISIAHPDFRDWLTDEAAKNGFS